MYFNKKYERVGPLFQGIYRAKLIENEEYLLHLSRYIHQDPKERGISPADFAWSSYKAYVGENSYSNWLKPQEILQYFTNTFPDISYKNFVEQNLNPHTPPDIKELTLEQ